MLSAVVSGVYSSIAATLQASDAVDHAAAVPRCRVGVHHGIFNQVIAVTQGARQCADSVASRPVRRLRLQLATPDAPTDDPPRTDRGPACAMCVGGRAAAAAPG